MGGEYLPPLLDDEVEIARISLASVTADQTSVRAQRVAGGIAYRIVDEYGEDGTEYVCRPDRSDLPLTLAELVAMIDGAQEGASVAMSALIYNVESGVDDPDGVSRLRARGLGVLSAARRLLRGSDRRLVRRELSGERRTASTRIDC